MNPPPEPRETHPGSHLEVSRVAAYVERALSAEERAAVEAHLAECATCRQEVSDTALFLGRRARRRAWRRAGRAAVPLAAAAALLLVLGTPDGTDRSAAERLRDPAGLDAGGLPVIEAVAPEEDAVLPADSIGFAWGAAGDEVLYRITVATEEGGVAWRGESLDTVVVLPDGVELEPGRAYHWFVDALLPDGREATTGVRRFRVVP